MVNKFFSELSIKPSLVEQLGFYSRRLHREESVRRLGLIMIVLSMIVQMFAVISPPERSLAQSNNDVIKGGVKGVGDLKDNVKAKKEVKALYAHYGLEVDEINAKNAENNNFGFQYQGSQGTRTVGRMKFDNTKDHNLGKFAGVNFYSRNAGEWYGSTNALYFGKQKAKDGHYYLVWVLKDCGNIAYRRADAPEPKKEPEPKLKIKKTIAGNPKKVKPGQTIKYVIEYKNTVKGSKAKDVELSDELSPNKFTVLDHKSLLQNDKLQKDLGNLDFSNNNHVFDFRIKIKNNLKHGTNVCNTVKLKASNADTVSDKICVPVDNPGDKPTPTDEPEPESEPEPEPEPTPTPEPEPEPEPETELSRSKSVQNITQNLSTKETQQINARSGDTLEYTLVIKNLSNVDVVEPVVKDEVDDLLDYATIDKGFLNQQGGTYSEQDKNISWQNLTIPAQSELQKTFRVTLKDRLPLTNQPNTTAPDFDCRMQNGFGNETVVKVSCSPIKKVETLPNTGPGETMAFAFATTTISGYFFARGRLLAKEVSIAKRIFPSSGSPL